MSSKRLFYRVFVGIVVVVMLASLAACGGDAPATALPAAKGLQAVTATPLPTNTPQPTATPVPSATPTEIPIILPTPTQVGILAPLPSLGLEPPTIPPAPTGTPGPTSTPGPTLPPPTLAPVLPPPTPAPTLPPPTATIPPTPVPTATPIPPLKLNLVVNYSYPLTGYSLLGYYPSPELTTQCIAETYLKRGVPAASSDPNILSAVAAEDYWYDTFKSRYVFLNGQAGAPNSTPPAVNLGTPVKGILPPSAVTVSSVITAPKPFEPGDELKLKTPLITTTLSALTDISYYKPDLMVMWNVMNSITRQLIDLTVDPRGYEQSYESALNELVNAVLRINPNSRIILGNVPDLTAMRYFKTCFNDAQLKQIQSDYNAMFASLAARYPNRVFVARLDLMDLRSNPIWIYALDGLRMTTLGAIEVAASFGREFQKIRYR